MQEINQPIDQLGPDSPAQTPFQYPPQSPKPIMARNVPLNCNANQANPPAPAWRARPPLNLAPLVHALPHNYENVLPRFDLGEGTSVDNHLQIFFLVLEALVVEHEDVVCRLFPHTLKGKAASWYFGLQANSITDFDTFERMFKSKFCSQRTTVSLMKGLLALKKENKEKVQDFTHRFAAHLKNFSAAIK